MPAKDNMIEIFCITDDFCKECDMEIKKHRIASDDGKKFRNRSCTVSGSEWITILWCFHFGSCHSFKHCYIHYVGEHLKNGFPDRLSCNRFIQLEHRVMIPLLPFLKLICSGECTGVTFVDSTGIAVCNSKRIMRNRVFRGLAETGKSSMGWFFGFKLHPVCDDKGELLNFCLTKGNVDDHNTDVFRVPGRNLSGKPYGVCHPPCLISFSVTVFTG